MARPPLKAVEAGHVLPPATLPEALEDAVARLRAAGAQTFALVWQVSDEKPTTVAFPNTLAVRKGITADAFNTVHFPEGATEDDDDE